MDEPGRKIKINRQNPKSCDHIFQPQVLFLKKKRDEINKKLKSNQKF